jgi:hypothetical protein
MSDMIERVARAIATEYSGVPDHDWTCFVDEARAAIEAFIAGIDRQFETDAWRAVRPYHDLSERDIRSCVPKDFFRLAISKTSQAALKGEAE